VIIIGAVNEARRDNEKDDFGYNPITMVFPNPRTGNQGRRL